MKNYVVYDTATGDVKWLTRAMTCQGEGVKSLGYSCMEYLGDDIPGSRHRVVDGAVVLKPQPELDALDQAAAWQSLRARRTALLAQTDILMLPDRWPLLPADQQSAWSAYRQALRDLPANTTDPQNPIWPNSP